MEDAELFRSLGTAARQLLGRFEALTPVQRAAIPSVLDSKPTLVVACTASGKTEAVLAPVLTLRERERWQGLPSVLYVAPTRALVNDLARRVEPRLAGFVEVGRRTGEYREPDRAVVITTPESLDSMLSRGARTAPHPLSAVRAVILDELHVFAEGPRGAQLQILLARLDEVAREPVLRVALSATVPDPRRLAWRFLGPEAAVCAAPGSREIRVLRADLDGPLPERGTSVDPLAKEILRVGRGPDGDAPLVMRLLELRRSWGRLKALVFVPSRARCDRLAAALTRALEGRAPVEVFAHHGSLDRQHREKTERALAEQEEAVAVATSTLEVGVDIGDIDVVVVDGPPGSVSALLQEIGRGNRRSGDTIVLPVARDDVAAVTLASMIRAATSGELSAAPEVFHASVAIQQAASILFQAARALRRRTSIERLLASAFGPRSARLVAQLGASGWLTIDDELVRPGDHLRELMDQPMRLHGNIGGSGSVVPLVDAVTGEPLAWVPRQATHGRIVLAGSSFVPEHREDRIELRAARRGGDGAVIRYASRKAPVARSALRHLCVGLGLPDRALVRYTDLFVHFGGALFGRALQLAGMPSGALRSEGDPRAAPHLLESAEAHWRDLESLCGFGPFQSDLPDTARRDAVIETVRAMNLDEWRAGLNDVSELDEEQRRVLAQA
jgi:ATP-dependent helicase Lhr and Lhr-like helicase